MMSLLSVTFFYTFSLHARYGVVVDYGGCSANTPGGGWGVSVQNDRHADYKAIEVRAWRMRLHFVSPVMTAAYLSDLDVRFHS